MKKFFAHSKPLVMSVWISLAACAFGSACSVAEPKAAANSAAQVPSAPGAANAAPAARGATIDIEPNGPADTVRTFYKHLREKRFREAIFLTNLRPAIEGLTETDLNDFSLDFAKLAGQIPAEVEINGEIVTGNKATVTANLPGKEDKDEIQTINLLKSGEVWIIQTVDTEAEQRIKKEGKNYFYNLRVETHEEEAKKMLERVSKAQLAHSLQNNGVYADMPTLIAAGLLPEDIRSSESTGYVYAVRLAADKKNFSATATPASYPKSGKQSFILKPDPKSIGRVTGKDNGGKQLSD